jgi:solute carrier family 35 protein F5
MRKAGSVIVSVVGVILVSKSDHEISGPSEPHRPSAPLLGDSLALASAVAYAFYVILLKVRIRNETRISMTLFFGFVGLFNIFGIWPLGMILHYADVEKFELPSGGMLWASIAANAAITFVHSSLSLFLTWLC